MPCLTRTAASSRLSRLMATRVTPYDRSSTHPTTRRSTAWDSTRATSSTTRARTRPSTNTILRYRCHSSSRTRATASFGITTRSRAGATRSTTRTSTSYSPSRAAYVPPTPTLVARRWSASRSVSTTPTWIRWSSSPRSTEKEFST